MWGLDRRSVHATPTGTPPPRCDTYSPAPRRPYGGPGPGPLPPRPGLPPRTSSLSLTGSLASSSTSSLPSTAQIPNGAGRRRVGPGGAPPPDVPHPLQVLEAILGGPPRKPTVAKEDDDTAVRRRPEEVVDEIDFGGLSLHDFVAADTPDARHSSPVHTYSAQSVEECTCFANPPCLHASHAHDVPR